MPVLKDFGGYQIRMYFRDHNPPHVHVVSANETALVSITDGSVIRGSIQNTILRNAQEWIAAHRTMLMEKWEEFQK